MKKRKVLHSKYINDERIYESIRKGIRRLREYHPKNGKKVTQQDLADAIGITRATLTNIELGNQRVQVNVIYRICDYFDVPLKEVMPEIYEVKENHTKAQKMVDSWPAWKKEVSLTKHSAQSSMATDN